MAHPDPAVPSRSLVRRRLVLRVLLAAAVVGIIYFGLLPKQVDVAEVWATLRAMTWLELVTLLAVAVWNLGSYLLPQLVALPGLSLRQAVLESHTSTAVGNLLPAGQAVALGVTWRFYSSYGFGRPAITLSLLVQGVWNNFVKLAMPVVALGLLVLSRRAAGELAPVAMVGVAVLAVALTGFALSLSSERRAWRIGAALATLAVLPFRSLSAESPDPMLELGLAETVIARLSRAGSVRVLSLASAERVAGRTWDPLAAARELGAAYVVEGSTQRRGDRVRVNVRLLAAPGGNTIWADTFDEHVDRVFTLQDGIAGAVLSALAVSPLAKVAASLCEGADARAFRTYQRSI